MAKAKNKVAITKRIFECNRIAALNAIQAPIKISFRFIIRAIKVIILIFGNYHLQEKITKGTEFLRIS